MESWMFGICLNAIIFLFIVSFEQGYTPFPLVTPIHDCTYGLWLIQVMNLMCCRLSLYLPSALSEFGEARLPWREWRWTERSGRTGCRTRERGACCWPWGDNRSKSRASTAGSFLWGDYEYRYFVWGFSKLLHGHQAVSSGWHGESPFQKLVVCAPRTHTNIDMLLHLKWHVQVIWCYIPQQQRYSTSKSHTQQSHVNIMNG